MEHFDVLIVGAGVSGIAAAYYLQKRCPKKNYLILESRKRIGGTWDLFKYPGFRSDSDMQTYGFSFRPWTQKKMIAEGDKIRDYIEETAREFHIYPKIRFRHKVVRASWSSAEALWTIEAEMQDESGGVQEHLIFTANFLFGCTGYYKYEEGYTPDFSGVERFQGKTVHPHKWPEDLIYAGKRLVVIGSGATAITLIPALAKKAAHVTMLQRSPTYIISLPKEDPMGAVFRFLPKKMAFWLARWRNIGIANMIYFLTRHYPKLMKKLLIKGVQMGVGKTYDVSTDFTPRYNPWDQRLCVVPDGDLFIAIREGKVDVVTGEVETFTEKGLRLKSGYDLDADIIVTATGFDLLFAGGIELNVDGTRMDISNSLTYKGAMCSDIPNFAIFIGYTNASWTLRIELICKYLCRLLNLMDKMGARQVTPRKPDNIAATEPFLSDFSPGYVRRRINLGPRQGLIEPWRMHQNYRKDFFMFKFGKLADEVLEFRS